MTTPTTRCKVPFLLTNANVFELLARFGMAAVSVGWSREDATQTVIEAMAGDIEHLHATLAKWCFSEQMNRMTE